MSPPLRWGLLGTAHVNRRLIPAMRAARRSMLAAVASRQPARAEDYAREWKIPVAHGSYEALLRDRGVDAVYVPLPNALHVEWTLRALDAGKHVLCEKPLALAPEDVERVEAVARARTLVVAEAFMYRHEPLIARVVQLVRDGHIGAITSMSAGFTYRQSRSPDVRLEAALGGGSLWDIGCYAVNAVRLTIGTEPTAVFGFAAMTPAGVDESFTGLLQFGGGPVATVHSSFRAPYRTWLDVIGSAGILRAANPFKPAPVDVIEIRRGEEVVHEAVEGSSMLFVRQIEDFVSAAVDGREPAVSLLDSRGNAAVLAALHASARSRRAVTL
ncbi:MAG TPA: Gfo/Idh/MocA family oxidoreductase [Vicinamibacterales bacterium]|nr:Gfo/Idh/MocA family oxidoreductase [Vicinamibacterales bacterium]